MAKNNETQYVEIILSLLDCDFIRRTDKNLEHITDEQLKQLILKGKDDIIVSQTHAQLITNNNLFDYDFYKSHYPELTHMNPTDVLNHYLIYGRDRRDIVSHADAQLFTQTPGFNIDFYKAYHSDLYNMDPIKIVNHYIRFGKKENRKCS